MSEIYPRRILNVIGALVAVLGLMMLAKDVSFLLNTFYNLVQVDKVISILSTVISTGLILAGITFYYKRTWSWLYVSSVIINDMLLAVMNEHELSSFEVGLYILILLCQCAVFVLLQLRKVKEYFNVGKFGLPLAIVIGVTLCAISRYDVISGSSELSSHYLEIGANNLITLNDTPFNGIITDFWTNGNKKVSSRIENGKEAGLCLTYDEHGNKESESFYVDGKMDGSYTKWHMDGELHVSGQYEMDKKTGLWKYWSKEGALLETEEYDNDTLIHSATE